MLPWVLVRVMMDLMMRSVATLLLLLLLLNLVSEGHGCVVVVYVYFILCWARSIFIWITARG